MTDVLGLEYVVLRCADLERSKSFYEALGLHFVPEQHGRGARHYSSSIGAVVIELYPLRDKASSGVRLGLLVARIDPVIEEMKRLGAEVLRIDETEGSAVLRDPDGHEIALRQNSGSDAVA